MKIRLIIISALMLVFLAGCANAKTAASVPSVTPAPTAVPTGTAGAVTEEPDGTANPSAAPSPDSSDGAAATEAPDGDSGSSAGTEVQEETQVLDGILDQLDQLDKLYSDLDEISDDDLNVD